MDLTNKTIIVTGGSGLIGRSIIKNILSMNGKVINVDLINFDGDHFFEKCDITDVKSIDKLLDTIISKFSKIDGLVNNAYPRTNDWGNKFEDIEYDSWCQNVDMQLNSMFYIIKSVVKIMKELKGGSIVNIASIYGSVGSDFTIYEGTKDMTSPAAYSAIKGGLINFTRYLSSYFGKYSIRVNCVSPGGVYDNQDKIFIKNYSNKVPLKRMADPNEIAPAVSFLLSESSSYITGHNLIIDGGWTAI
jgi:NAD(P)-dependent dehydrogenase (short-subunit alcohol dehydrogenase family)